MTADDHAAPEGADSPASTTSDGTAGGSGLAAERQRRQQQVDDLRAAGVQPYPYRYDRTHAAADVQALGSGLEPGTETDTELAVAGRLMLKRDTGKLIFASLSDRGTSVQLFISKAVVGDEAFELAKHLDRGDWVGASGTLMTTRTGEVSVKVASLRLLSKSIRPLPDKWHGLSDVDTRFRQRYVDLIVNDEARRVFTIRHAVISSMRATLAGRGFIEVETPVLHVEVGGATARPFITHHNTLDMPLYLRIATELHLKRLIVGGLDRVFEFGRTFRNEGMDTTHNPEFTMMESYQAFGDVNEAMELTEALLTNAARDATGSTVVTIGDTAVELTEPWPRVRMIDLVSSAVGEAVHPSRPVDELRAIAARHDVHVERSWGSGKIVEELFESLCEDSLVRPTFVTGHPVEVSPLARLDPNDAELTDRFELFIGGKEYANGYSELNDPVDQRRRFEAEQAAKDAGDDERGSIDEDYLRALEYGLPPTAGLGVGIDRAVMLLAGVDSIREVILFPTMRPEVLRHDER